MNSVRELHQLGDAEREALYQEKDRTIWSEWVRFYTTTRELRQAAFWYDQRQSTEHYDRLITAALLAHDTDVPAMCLIVSNSGPNGEPLACGYPSGHDGAHAWATLPTFVGAPGDRAAAGRGEE